MAFFALKTFVSKLAGRRTRMIFWMIFFAMVAAGGYFSWNFIEAEPIEAEDEIKKWKVLSEDRFGLNMDYPSNWDIRQDYDKYAAGLMNVDLNNKKNGSGAECGSRYVDLRIFIGNKPESGAENSGSDLLSQLYREIEMIKNSGNDDLVESMKIEGKSAFKIKSDAPTLSLNGRCPGPLYLVDTKNSFIYIFAGTGSEARETGEKAVEKIIASINID